MLHGGGRVALLVALVSLLSPGGARAYCLTSTCEDCPRDPDGCTIGGRPIAWPGRCVSLGVHEAASEQVDLATVERLTEQAFATWNAVRCEPSGEPPSIELVGTEGPVVCGRSEFVGNSANANVLVFRDDDWPYGGSGFELASTVVRSRSDGEIVDADIEVNATLPLITGEHGGPTITGAHDLLSILIHEMGHLLGLDHSSDPDAIMQVELQPRVVRTELGADDVAALCAAYPPEREAPPCDPAPLGGFSAQCALDPSTGGACSVAAPGNSGSGATLWLLLLGLVAIRGRCRACRASRADDTGARG
jgi:hypothetical protein